MARCNKIKPRKDDFAEIIVITEGEKTEPEYFKKLIQDLIEKQLVRKDISRKLQIENNGKKTSVANLFKKADEEQDKTVFVVFDDDDKKENGSYLKKYCYPQELNEIKNKGVNCIYSNPCFEYWALLHFRCSDSLYEVEEVCSELTKYMQKYNPKKNKIFDYKLMTDKEDAATNHAKKIRQNHKKGNGRPWVRSSTNVDVLIDFIKDYFKIK